MYQSCVEVPQSSNPSKYRSAGTDIRIDCLLAERATVAHASGWRPDSADNTRERRLTTRIDQAGRSLDPARGDEGGLLKARVMAVSWALVPWGDFMQDRGAGQWSLIRRI